MNEEKNMARQEARGLASQVTKGALQTNAPLRCAAALRCWRLLLLFVHRCSSPPLVTSVRLAPPLSPTPPLVTPHYLRTCRR